MNIVTRALLLAGALCAGQAGAHIVLEQKSAPAGSYFKANFLIGHGCNGSATKSLRFVIPEGINAVRPAPKPGWQLALRTDPLATPYEQYGRKVTERVSDVTWNGGPLADAQFDEFTMLVKLPDKPVTLHFRVFQECEQGRNDWVQMQEAGQPAPRWPAVVLEVTPAVEKPHH